MELIVCCLNRSGDKINLENTNNYFLLKIFKINIVIIKAPRSTDINKIIQHIDLRIHNTYLTSDLFLTFYLLKYSYITGIPKSIIWEIHLISFVRI
jgi:hypothetical protein